MSYEQEEQRTPNQKYPQRIGLVTSSKIKTVLDGWSDATYYAASNKEKAGEIKTPAGWGKGAVTYARILALNILGYDPEQRSSSATRWGHEYEPVNRSMYAQRLNAQISGETFVVCPDVEGTGSTPDGLFDNNTKVFESKCLQEAAHLDALEAPDEDHVLQCQHQMLCTGATEAHLVYFHPEIPHGLDAHQKAYIIQRDEGVINEMKVKIAMFLPLIEKWRKIYAGEGN